MKSLNRVRPAARSTLSTAIPKTNKRSDPTSDIEKLPGTTKLSKGVSSGIAALGSTNAPVLTSRVSGVEGEDGLLVSTTFAKCVGTPMFGGVPMTSCVCSRFYSSSFKHVCRANITLLTTRHFPSGSLLGR